MSFKLDFSKAPKGFELLPQGIYELEVQKIDVRHPKEKDGAEYFNIDLVVCGDDDYDGRHVFTNISTGETSLGVMMNFLMALGFTENTLMDEDNPFILDPEDLIGLRLRAKVGIKTSQEYDDQNVIKKYVMPEPEGE